MGFGQHQRDIAAYGRHARQILHLVHWLRTGVKRFKVNFRYIGFLRHAKAFSCGRVHFTHSGYLPFAAADHRAAPRMQIGFTLRLDVESHAFPVQENLHSIAQRIEAFVLAVAAQA